MDEETDETVITQDRVEVKFRLMTLSEIVFDFYDIAQEHLRKDTDRYVSTYNRTGFQALGIVMLEIPAFSTGEPVGTDLCRLTYTDTPTFFGRKMCEK